MTEKWGGIKKSSVMENVPCRTSIFFQFITLLASQKSNIVICAINKVGRCAFPESLTWQISVKQQQPCYLAHTAHLIHGTFAFITSGPALSFPWIFMSSTLTFAPTEDLELPSWPRSSCQRPLGGSRTAWKGPHAGSDKRTRDLLARAAPPALPFQRRGQDNSHGASDFRGVRLIHLGSVISGSLSPLSHPSLR